MTDRDTLKEFAMAIADVATIAPDFDSYDPWGSAMAIGFACADHLYRRDEPDHPVPDDWQYRPGLGYDDPDPLYADFSSAWLIRMGNRAIELARICDDLGLSY